VRVRGRAVSGTASDLACGQPASVKVRVALEGRAWSRTVRVRGARWRLTLPRRGRRVRVVAIDAAGQRSVARRRTVAEF